MTHLKDEERRHALGLPELAIAVIEGDEDLSDSLYCENLANSSTEMRIDLSEVSFSEHNMGQVFLYWSFPHSNFVCPDLLQ